MTKNKIGVILDNTFPPDSRVENEAVSLIEAGFEVHMFSLSWKELPAYEQVNGIHVHRYHASNITYRLSALAYTFPFYCWIVRPKIQDFIKKTGIHFLHVHDMVIAESAMKANNGALPLTLDLHEHRPAIMEFYRHVKSFPGNFLINLATWNKIQDELIMACDFLVLVTQQAKEWATARGLKEAEKIIVVPNTAKLNIFKEYPIQEEILERYKKYFTLVYVGDTSLRRGTDTAIRAVALLKEKIRNIRLVLVGENKEDKLLKELAEQEKVSHLVDFEGWQDVSLFPSYIEAAQVCLAPLKKNLHTDTTFTNKFFQYLSMGKAVITSNMEAQKKVSEEEKCALVHESGNAYDLAQKIEMLYENPDLRIELEVNAKRTVQDFWNWENTSKGLINHYKKLADS